MSEIVLGLILVFIVLCLALYGFVKLLTGFFSETPSSPEAANEETKHKTRRSLQEDVQGSSHLLNYLYQQKRISRKVYERLSGYLNQEYGSKWELANQLPPSVEPSSPKPKVDKKLKVEKKPSESVQALGVARSAAQNSSAITERGHVWLYA